jgi:hypothetical protein
MAKLFIEEQEVLDRLLEEWYGAMHQFTEAAEGVFSEKGKVYDRESPVWERVRFPHGFVQELRKKADRLNQQLATYDGTMESVDWSLEGGVLEELIDVMNYARMMGAIVGMKLREGRHG